MTRLDAATRPAPYDRARPVGIVHFGLGAFARAHLAWYTDHAMRTRGGDWMIAGVSLRSADVGARLNPQDGLYTLTESAGAEAHTQIIASIAEVLLATDHRAEIVDRLAAPTTHLVTFTVTEKGYCRAADGTLDLALAERGFYPLLAEAFARRAAAGHPGLTLLSCDNLADNGRQLAALMAQWLAARAPDLAPWFAAHCACPSSMVDRIVPATTAADLAHAAAALGSDDAGAVNTEPFSQWVIEDRFAGPRPAWHTVGADIVSDVAPYETAKLRMLNGAHSALAYLGLRAGYTYVHEAVADPVLRTLAETLMRAEAAPTIAAAPGQDLDAYAEALLARFANPALNHRLIQIAMDGSQKIPQRWLATLAARGGPCPAILAALAAWLRHIRGDNLAQWGPVNDPRAAELAAAWARHGAEGIVTALFGEGGLIASPWRPTAQDRATLAAALAPEPAQ